MGRIDTATKRYGDETFATKRSRRIVRDETTRPFQHTVAYRTFTESGL